MRVSALGRFLIIGLMAASALGVASFFALRELNETSTADVRRNMILFIAQNVEQAVEAGADYPSAMQELRLHSGRRLLGTSLWVFSPTGQVLAASGEQMPPVDWQELKKPEEAHDFIFHYRSLRLIPDLALIRLGDPQANYLLVEFRRPANTRGAPWTQIAFVLFVLSASMLIAVSIAYFYLRRKSDEARAVLARLEKGDLKARFEITGVDEIGSLMGDFNRMASEIERLVHRVQETELARKNLLEELSHDLRTPLTSLKTSAETLVDHWNDMPKEEQFEFVSVIKTELGYFLHLIEDLFFIAAIGEPKYKKTTQLIDLRSLLEGEIHARKTTSTSKGARALDWSLAADVSDIARAEVIGDPLLIQRLFKNALDNAARHARSKVQVEIHAQERSVRIEVRDDGPGISDASIAVFGARRKNRFDLAENGGTVSLGLGSVIMKTILDLHGGASDIQRLRPPESGTLLTLHLPMAS